jgi:hypothetical protein
MRCDTGGASGHVTIKPSICNWPVFYKSSVYAVKVSCLTPLKGVPRPREVCQSWKEPLNREQSRLITWQKSAAGIVGGFSPPKAQTIEGMDAGEEHADRL